MFDYVKWIVDTIKNDIKKEIGRSQLHWYGYGAGVFYRPNGVVVGCKFQNAVDAAVKAGLIARRKTAKGKVYLRLMEDNADPKSKFVDGEISQKDYKEAIGHSN